MTFVTREQAETDAFDMAQQIHTLQAKLPELEEELKAALIAYRDGRHQVLVAEAKKESVKAAIDIVKSRIMALQSILRALPR
jgi:chromosome segregation ATPase